MTTATINFDLARIRQLIPGYDRDTMEGRIPGGASRGQHENPHSNHSLPEFKQRDNLTG